MSQKTVIIWDSVGEDDIKFLVVEGDRRHLNNCYLNSDSTEEQEDELMSLTETEEGPVVRLKEFPTEEVISGAYVIVAGYIP